jgi:hypothetical protein
MQVQISLTGTTPLLMHSDRGVNPEHPLNREKALIVKKTSSKRTAEENREIRRLEWLLGIYTDGERVIYPTANVGRCLREAGKITKQGTQIVRGLSLDGIEVPLQYARNGHETVEDLFTDPDFVDERSVGVGAKRVMRVRPRFMPWAVSVTGELFDDVMDVTDLRRIAALAGRAIGLGDNRVNGHGRFTAEVEAVG